MRQFLVLLLAATISAGEAAWTEHPLSTSGAPYGYLEHLPPDYAKTPKTKRPLVFFLHGMGELGDSEKELAKVAVNGPFTLFAKGDPLTKVLDGQSAIIVGPQGLAADKWWKTDKLITTLDVVLKQHQIDPDRIYITGLSMGGGGTWAMASNIAERLAAAVPICGASKAGDATKLRGLPIWACHAIDDPTVKFADNTQTWIEAILNDSKALPAGGLLAGRPATTDKPWTGFVTRKGWQWQEGQAPPAPVGKEHPLILTVYPNGGHDSWTRTYQNPAMWEWLFAQRRVAKAKAGR